MSLFSFFTVVLLSYFRFAVAFPTANVLGAIDPGLLAHFTLFEQYAAAAYCSSNNDSPQTKVTCLPCGGCPLVEAANTQTVIEFQNSLLTDVTGFLAIDSTNKLIVISYRGSGSVRNWLSNLVFPLTETDICDGCLAETGFWTSWLEARDDVLAAARDAAEANPTYSIVATGHSLGGALAALTAARLRNEGYAVAMYSFGAPRVGNAKLSNYISNQQGGNYRVTHLNDPVPRLPPRAFGYAHISPEYYISSKNGDAVKTWDVSCYQGVANFQGNSAWATLDAKAHAWYFDNISACYPNNITEFRRAVENTVIIDLAEGA